MGRGWKRAKVGWRKGRNGWKTHVWGRAKAVEVGRGPEKGLGS